LEAEDVNNCWPHSCHLGTSQLLGCFGKDQLVADLSALLSGVRNLPEQLLSRLAVRYFRFEIAGRELPDLCRGLEKLDNRVSLTLAELEAVEGAAGVLSELAQGLRLAAEWEMAARPFLWQLFT